MQDKCFVKYLEPIRKGVRHQKPERPEGCIAFLVPDPFSLATPRLNADETLSLLVGKGGRGTTHDGAIDDATVTEPASPAALSETRYERHRLSKRIGGGFSSDPGWLRLGQLQSVERPDLDGPDFPMPCRETG